MSNLSYEESKKIVLKGLFLLAIVTVIEVFISLLGKGHIFAGLEDYKAVFYVVGFFLISLSLYKAYFIVYEFMHMRYEVKALAWAVLLPMSLLIWAVIAFFQEGNAWKKNREDRPLPKTEQTQEGQQGMLLDDDVYIWNQKG